MRTGWECVKLGKALYIIPLVFAFGSLLDPKLSEIIFDVVCLLLGFWALQVALTGYWRRDLNMPARIFIGLTAIGAMYGTAGTIVDGLPYLALMVVFTAGFLFTVKGFNRPHSQE